MKTSTRVCLYALVYACLLQSNSLFAAAPNKAELVGSQKLGIVDKLAAIKDKAKVTIGITMIEPFAVQNKDNTVSGYDVDFAIAIAQKLGVKAVVVPLIAEERVQAIQSGRVDMVFGFTKSTMWEKDLLLSTGYMVTEQKVIAPIHKVKKINDIAMLTTAVVKGTASEPIIKKEIPSIRLLTFDTLQQAFDALDKGQVQAVTADDPALLGQQNKLHNKKLFEIPPVSISIKIYSIGVAKNETSFMNMLNQILADAEKDGSAQNIFDRWFGPQTAIPMTRTFKIK